MQDAAVAAYTAGDYECSLFNRLLAYEIGGPGIEDTATSLARSLIVQGQASTVAAAYERALPYDPDNSDWRLLLTAADLALDDLPAAEAAAQPLFESTPTYQSAANTLFGDYFARKGDLEKALIAYERADQAEPTGLTALRLASTFISLHRPEASLEYAERATRASDALNRARGYQQWGRALQQLSRLEDAEQRYRQGMTEDPTYPGNAVDIAGLLNRQGRSEEAIAILRAAISQAAHPDYEASAEFALATIYEANAAPRQAAEHYLKAVELQPDNAGYTLKAARVLRDQDRIGEALALLDNFLQHHADDAEVRALRDKMSAHE
jgi:tetratricopeptide (TPR) repeat protein